MTYKFNKVLELVEVHVRAKFRQTKCGGSRVIVLTNFFALSRNGEESENPDS